MKINLWVAVIGITVTQFILPNVSYSAFLGDFNSDGVVSIAEVQTCVNSFLGITSNFPPTASAGKAQNVAKGVVVTLDGSGSSDPNGDPLTYRWSFTSKPAGSSAVLSNITIVKPVFTPEISGTYIINLVVNDGKVSSAASTVTITVIVGDAIVPADGYIQNRTFEYDPSIIVSWIVANTLTYSSAVFKDSAGNSFIATSWNSDVQEFDCGSGSSCAVGAFYKDSGYYHYFPSTASFVSGTQNVELTPYTGGKIIKSLDYSATLKVPVISSSTITVSNNSGTYIDFAWQNPTEDSNWTNVANLRMEIRDPRFPDKGIYVNLSNTAQSVSLPRTYLSYAGFDPNSSTLYFSIETRAVQNGARGVTDGGSIPVR